MPKLYPAFHFLVEKWANDCQQEFFGRTTELEKSGKKIGKRWIFFLQQKIFCQIAKNLLTFRRIYSIIYSVQGVTLWTSTLKISKTKGNKKMASKNFIAEYFENERREEKERILGNIKDDGRFGRAFELACRRAMSRKTKVAAQGRADTYIVFNGRYIAAECKTNGGRVQSLYAPGAPKFVIYKLDAIQRRKADKTHETAWEVHWYCAPVIVPTALFLQALEECNAIKHTNGANDELAIQTFNRKFYKRLKEWPIAFSKTARYTSADFDGLVF